VNSSGVKKITMGGATIGDPGTLSPDLPGMGDPRIVYPWNGGPLPH